MPFGYNGKILHVNLSSKEIEIEQPTEEFYRMYMGGSALGTYYCIRDIPKGADPLGPDNVLVLAPSVITGAPVPCLSRFTATAKSPLTGAIGDAQGGGWWAPELKWAGFDAVVVKGASKTPVYVYIENGDVQIRDASHIWGKTTGEAESIIRQELDDDRIRFLGIGQGGENLVKYACIINERKHAAGRTGMGAVMGSKILKGIAVRGNPANLKYYDRDKMREISRLASDLIKNNPVMKGLQDFGTNSGLVPQQLTGGLPTRNFSSGVFSGYENLSAEKMHQTIFLKAENCYACPVRCKRVVKAEEPYETDPSYGGPEYETVAALGTYTCVDDMNVVAKGNELCNKYSLDTISTGSSIAFAMECFEKGLISLEDSDGLELRFGNKDVIIPLIEKIAFREGIGDLLAEGPREAARRIGKGAEKFAMEVKGNPLPAHMPRVKRGLALAYAVNPFGADHVSTDQDPAFAPDAPELFKNRMKYYGLYTPESTTSLETDKVRMLYYTQQYFSLMDTLTVCVYGYGTVFMYDMEHLVQIVRAITGWNVSSWELMKVGERRTNLMRAFNAREGFSSKDDTLPERLFEELKEGPSKGLSVGREELEGAKKKYYAMAGWDEETGNPKPGKLMELGLEWVLKQL
jgi:aldehyde:ferredoxin oxidoreductase